MQHQIRSAPLLRRVDVDARPLRWAGVALVGVLAVLPLLPGGDAIWCPLRSSTGVPCPFCGMTRGVADLVRGDVGGALAHNPGSVLLVVAVVALLVAARRVRVTLWRWAPFAAVAGLWVYQLGKLVAGRPW